MMKGFTTQAIHGAQSKKDIHGSLRVPIYANVAFEHESARDIQLAFEGKKPAHLYSRITNPTVEDLEQRIRLLTGGTAVIAVASGMAAITSVILALAETGSNIVTTRHLFGNTCSLFEKTLGPWGLETRYVSMTDPDQVEQAINSRTRAIFLENISNPQLEVADFSALSQIAGRHGVPLIADCTATTPYLFKSKNFGVDLEIISSTKYISGGATSVGGLIIDNENFDWKQCPRLAAQARKLGPMALMVTLRREVNRNLGACFSAHSAYLHSLGLETLGLRIERSCENTLALAQFLEEMDGIRQVNYPGLVSSPYHQIARDQFQNRFGGILTFDLASQEACFRFIDALRLIKRSTNINDNKTMIIHPSSTIYCEYSETEKIEMGVRPTMVRLSVGIEDQEDLIDDLERGRKAL